MILRRTLVALPALLIVSACTQAAQQSATGSSAKIVPSQTATSAPTNAGSSTATIRPTARAAKAVHVSLLESDGGRYGVGMPIIAWFTVAPTDGTAFAKATSVTANDSPVKGAWYFEKTSHAGSALEGHFRPRGYWPAHADIELNLPVKGLSAGAGLVYDDSLTLSIATTAAHISTVDAHSLRMTVRTDGKVYGVFPISLGAAKTPTVRGTKVIMEKGRDISMRGPGYYDAHVKWTQRLTYGGEYLHAAPWNIKNLGVRSTSNGCTNLDPALPRSSTVFSASATSCCFPMPAGPPCSWAPATATGT